MARTYVGNKKNVYLIFQIPRQIFNLLTNNRVENFNLQGVFL